MSSLIETKQILLKYQTPSNFRLQIKDKIPNLAKISAIYSPIKR